MLNYYINGVGRNGISNYMRDGEILTSFDKL